MKNLPEQGKWLIGVSGGPDSMALLSMCIEAGVDCAAAHVNYHHRPEADEEEAYVRQYCAEHNVPVYVRNEPFLYKGNFEAAAREWRYAFFRRLAEEEGFSGVLIAHQEDDLLETWYMQKERNLVPKTWGLSAEGNWHGMKVARPLLGYTAAELKEYCRSHGVKYYTDSTNASPEYARNRIRMDTVSGMNEEERQAVRREIDEANRYMQKIRTQAGHLLRREKILLEEYREQDEEVRLAALRMLGECSSVPGPFSRAQLQEADHVLMTQKDFVIPFRSLNLVQDNGFVFFAESGSPYTFVINEPSQLHTIASPYFRIAEGTAGTMSVTVSAEDYPLTLRSWQEGDSIQMRFGTKPVHRFFIDRHIPRYLRDTWPVLVNCKGDVILVPGLGCDRYHYSIKPDFSVLQYSNSKGAFSMLEKDIKKILVTHDEIVARCAELGKQITEDYKDQPPLLVALLRGSVPFLAELIQHIDLDIQYDFMDVKSYEGTESTGDIKIIKDLDTSIKGMDILLVEDIVDTGRTIRTVVDTLKHKGAKSVKVVTMLDKPDRRVVVMDPDYTGFTIENLFVVGFGLDFNQRYRALPYVGVLKDECYQ